MGEFIKFKFKFKFEFIKLVKFFKFAKSIRAAICVFILCILFFSFITIIFFIFLLLFIFFTKHQQLRTTAVLLWVEPKLESELRNAGMELATELSSLQYGMARCCFFDF